MRYSSNTSALAMAFAEARHQAIEIMCILDCILYFQIIDICLYQLQTHNF